jgi:hypothetical protein
LSPLLSGLRDRILAHAKHRQLWERLRSGAAGRASLPQ